MFLCPQLLISCYPKPFFLLTWQTCPFINICTCLLYLLDRWYGIRFYFCFILKNVIWTNHTSSWQSFFKFIQSLLSRKWHALFWCPVLQVSNKTIWGLPLHSIKTCGAMMVEVKREECWLSWKNHLDGTKHVGMLLSSSPVFEKDIYHTDGALDNYKIVSAVRLLIFRINSEGY